MVNQNQFFDQTATKSTIINLVNVQITVSQFK